MELSLKVSVILILAIVSPIATSPFQSVKALLGALESSNPFSNLTDIAQLQDTTGLDNLAQLSKNGEGWFGNPLESLPEPMQDGTVLDNIAEMSKNGVDWLANSPQVIPGSSVLSGINTDSMRTRMDFRPLCSDTVLNFNGREDVKFILYNERFPLGVDISKNMNDEMLIKDEPIKFVIHGFLNGPNSLMVTTVKDAYMSMEDDQNVIVVDWSKGSGAWLSNYFVCLISSRIVPMVGEAVGEFILNMINEKNVNILYINVIGHSLGAQIAGLAGKHVISKGHIIPIIVGLDPANPGFKGLDESHRLCATDAEYVEAIHTNCGELGIMEPVGTADFYPNFHKFIERMPGCIKASCSHSMSFKYFAESIKHPFGFEAHKCKNFDGLKNGKCDGYRAYMGGGEMRVGKLAGIFLLETRPDEPYGLSIH